MVLTIFMGRYILTRIEIMSFLEGKEILSISYICIPYYEIYYVSMKYHADLWYGFKERFKTEEGRIFPQNNTLVFELEHFKIVGMKKEIIKKMSWYE